MKNLKEICENDYIKHLLSTNLPVIAILFTSERAPSAIKGQNPVSFSAIRGKTLTANTEPVTVTWDKLYSNTGGDFDPKTGTFTCSVAGESNKCDRLPQHEQEIVSVHECINHDKPATEQWKTLSQ